MNILIATDGSPHARAALDFVLKFPFPRDALMTLLTVVDDVELRKIGSDSLDDEQTAALAAANETLRDDAARLVESEGQRLRHDDWAGSTLVREGDPAELILQVAREIAADLIVIGSHGSGGIRRFLLGSVSDSLLHTAPCSVLIVKAPLNGEATGVAAGGNAPLRLLLAYDHSEVADQALDLCASLPLEPASEVRVISVMPLITAYRQDIRQHLNTIWQSKKQSLQVALEKAVRSLTWVTPIVTTELHEADNVSDEILAVAEAAQTDLLVVGCKDKGTVRRLLFGSETYRLARYAKCSVWVVRDRQQA